MATEEAGEPGPSGPRNDNKSPEYRLQYMTASEFSAQLETIRVAVIPLGATEQHGEHLATGVDGIVAERLAEQIVSRGRGRAIMTPPIYIGFSPHHQNFPGTLTARPQTIEALLFDIISSLKNYGISRFLIVNGHGGNLAFLPAWMSQTQDMLDVMIAVAHWSMLGRDVVDEIKTSDVIGHACEVETSLVLDLAPELVHHPLPGPSPVLAAPHSLVSGHVVPERSVGIFMPRPFNKITANGAVGDPSSASSAGGAKLREAVVERAVEYLEWFSNYQA